MSAPSVEPDVTAAWVESILDHVTYKVDWSLRVGIDDTRVFLQVLLRVFDHDVDDMVTHSGRKWLISPHMTRSEVIQTAFKAFLTAEEHECRELFRYRGVRIFGPHIDAESLADAMVSGAVTESVREDKPS